MFPEGGQTRSITDTLFPINVSRRQTNLETLVVYHLHKDSGNFGWKINGTFISGPTKRKIAGINGLLEKVVLSDRLVRSNRSSSFHFHFFCFCTSSRLFATYFSRSYLSALASS